VIHTIREIFENHGFQPLDTPAFERVETLLGKYGEEEKLVFKILKRGEGGKRGEIDLALRYDLTVPLARVMGMHTELTLPFRRWQIAPVWRADRPSRGRYREFLQCDVDIIGARGATSEAECIAVADAALLALSFEQHRFRLNDRRILKGIAAACDATEKESDLLVAVDKLDKIGQDGVTKELIGRGFTSEQTNTLWQYMAIEASDDATLRRLEASFEALGDESVREDALAGVESLRRLLSCAQTLGVARERLTIDPTLARGLNYYTGPVYEIQHPEFRGSLGGGGRYDQLIRSLGGPDLPAVGISLGLERLILILQERAKEAPQDAGIDLLVTCFDEAHRDHSMAAAAHLRKAGLRVDLYPTKAKLKKQFKYANSLGIPWIIVIGPDEVEGGTVRLRQLSTGDQQNVALDAVAGVINGAQSR
jgi:histidyl-tRNA synthetase